MKIKTLLSDKSKWAKGWFAYDKYGFCVDAVSERAACYCLMGAVNKCYPNRTDTVMKKLLTGIQKTQPRVKSVVSWNDNSRRKFSEVKRLVTKLDI